MTKLSIFDQIRSKRQTYILEGHVSRTLQDILAVWCLKYNWGFWSEAGVIFTKWRSLQTDYEWCCGLSETGFPDFHFQMSLAGISERVPNMRVQIWGSKYEGTTWGSGTGTGLPNSFLFELYYQTDLHLGYRTLCQPKHLPYPWHKVFAVIGTVIVFGHREQLGIMWWTKLGI